MLSQALWGSDQDFNDWRRVFFPEIHKQQMVTVLQPGEKQLGWWTPESLGVPNAPEVKGMSENERTMYATSIMLLTYPPIRYLPSFRPVIDIETNSPDAEIPITFK